MAHSAAVPFTLKRSQDVLGSSYMTTTTETVHGLLRLDGDRVVIQWRLGRETEHIGTEIRTEREYEAVREVVVPLDALAGAHIRTSWLAPWRGGKLVLTAADLQAFEDVAGEGGLRQNHPAELVVRIRRSDRVLADEFSAELVLALAERALEAHQRRSLVQGREKPVAENPEEGR